MCRFPRESGAGEAVAMCGCRRRDAIAGPFVVGGLEGGPATQAHARQGDGRERDDGSS